MNRLAVASPMPVVPPVMTAVVPLRSAIVLPFERFWTIRSRIKTPGSAVLFRSTRDQGDHLLRGSLGLCGSRSALVQRLHSTNEGEQRCRQRRCVVLGVDVTVTLCFFDAVNELGVPHRIRTLDGALDIIIGGAQFGSALSHHAAAPCPVGGNGLALGADMTCQPVKCAVCGIA